MAAVVTVNLMGRAAPVTDVGARQLRRMDLSSMSVPLRACSAPPKPQIGSSRVLGPESQSLCVVWYYGIDNEMYDTIPYSAGSC
jgi:hypothetical protein